MDYRDFPLFATLSAEDVEQVVRSCERIEFSEGETFIEEGGTGEFIYFLLDGHVSIIVTGSGGLEHELATIKGPAVIGELEALTGERRSASVRASSDVTALRLSFEHLRSGLEQGDAAMRQIFLNVAQVIAHRLTAMNEKFVELQRTGGPRYHELRDFQEKLLNE